MTWGVMTEPSVHTTYNPDQKNTVKKNAHIFFFLGKIERIGDK